MLFDFLVTDAGGIGLGTEGSTGSEGFGIAGSDGVCVGVGGCGLVCGFIRLCLSLIYKFIVSL